MYAVNRPENPVRGKSANLIIVSYSSMFNNCNSKVNGEYAFYVRNRHLFRVVFDVGCRYDSEFLDFKGEVHYFDPSQEFIQRLSSEKMKM